MIFPRCRRRLCWSIRWHWTAPLGVLESPWVPRLPDELRSILGPKTSQVVLTYNTKYAPDTVIFYHNPDVPESVDNLEQLRKVHAQETFTRVPHAPLRFRLAIEKIPVPTAVVAALLGISPQPWDGFIRRDARGRADVRAADLDALVALLAKDPTLHCFPLVAIIPGRDCLPGLHFQPPPPTSTTFIGKRGKKKRHRIPPAPPIFTGHTASIRAISWLQSQRRKAFGGGGPFGQLKGAERKLKEQKDGITR